MYITTNIKHYFMFLFHFLSKITMYEMVFNRNSDNLTNFIETSVNVYYLHSITLVKNAFATAGKPFFFFRRHR